MSTFVPHQPVRVKWCGAWVPARVDRVELRPDGIRRYHWFHESEPDVAAYCDEPDAGQMRPR